MSAPQNITDKTIRRVLIGGFALVLAALLTLGLIGVRSLTSIRENANLLVTQQHLAARLIEDIQAQVATLNAVIHEVLRDPVAIDRATLLAELDESDQEIARLAESGGLRTQSIGRKFLAVSKSFSVRARRLLQSGRRVRRLDSTELFMKHHEVISLASQLINASYLESLQAQRELDHLSSAMVWRLSALFAVCVLLAFVCAAFTVRITGQLSKRLESQAGELSAVSWHMLENQEAAARRFSHELHDELGQSLTAVKANLVALDSASIGPQERVDDCLRLLEESIGNVRELSQLLRPTILDDFGLDPALRWLAEGFSNRTGISVTVDSECRERLPEQIETHLFRIAQEALTNVARHSQATQVTIAFAAGSGKVRLVVEDNGLGLPAASQNGTPGLGMVGMRARARSAGGEVTFRSAPGRGLRLEVELRQEVRT